jgi:hypothetical protein
MQMMNYMSGLSEDERKDALGLLGNISEARSAGRPTGTKPPSTFGDKTEYTKAISSIENSLSSIPALSQAGKTRFSSLSPESQEVIERYAQAWTQYRLAGEFGRSTNEEYQTPPDILPVIAEILRYELEPSDTEEE